MVNSFIFFIKHKKNIFISAVIFFLILGYVLSSLSKRINNDKYIVVKEPNISISETQNITIQKLAIDENILPVIPNSLPVYSSESQQNAMFLAQHISKELNLKKHDTLENIWINDQNHFLSFSPTSDQITLSNLQVEVPTSDDKKITVDRIRASQIASQYIKDLNLGFELVVNTNVANHREGITISFIQQINGYNLFHTDQNTTTSIVYLTENYKVSKLVINNPSFLVSKKGDVETKSANEIISQIKNNEGVIISNEGKSQIITDYSDIESLTLESSSIEYRDDIENGTIIPYIKLNGTGLSIKKEIVVIEIILPLIKTLEI
jgi:hypothetical protein